MFQKVESKIPTQQMFDMCMFSTRRCRLQKSEFACWNANVSCRMYVHMCVLFAHRLYSNMSMNLIQRVDVTLLLCLFNTWCEARDNLLHLGINPVLWFTRFRSLSCPCGCVKREIPFLR
jgi:hypothetical protein